MYASTVYLALPTAASTNQVTRLLANQVTCHLSLGREC